MTKFDQILAGVIIGRESRCPFCSAKSASKPNVGDRVKILNGCRAGIIGTVTKTELDSRFTPTTFLIKANIDNPNWEQIVDPSRDLIQILPEPPIPDWAPPLSLREAEALDHAIVKFCEKCTGIKGWEWNQQAFYEIIRHSWQKRLPITEEELWKVLLAHGIPRNERKRVKRLFKEGREVLIYTMGRKPIKKNRVKPLSISI